MERQLPRPARFARLRRSLAKVPPGTPTAGSWLVAAAAVVVPLVTSQALVPALVGRPADRGAPPPATLALHVVHDGKGLSVVPHAAGSAGSVDGSRAGATSPDRVGGGEAGVSRSPDSAETTTTPTHSPEDRRSRTDGPRAADRHRDREDSGGDHALDADEDRDRVDEGDDVSDERHDADEDPGDDGDGATDTPLRRD
jgi:hypothetical protein